MASPSSGLHAFGLNDNPVLFTDAVQPYESHPFAQGADLPQWSHQDFSAKKSVCIADLRRAPLGEFGGDGMKEWRENIASCDKQREVFLEDQRQNLKRTDSPTMKELFQPGDKDEGDGYWGVIREGREAHTPHWSHWQFTMKKTHHATGVHKTPPAACDVNAQSASQSHYRDPKTWSSSNGGSRRESARSNERGDQSAGAMSKKSNHSSHAHLALAKRRHATQIEANPAKASTQRVFEAMESPTYQYFSDLRRSSRPSSSRRSGGSSPGFTPYPLAAESMDDYSPAYGAGRRQSGEISPTSPSSQRKVSVPGYSLDQISRHTGIELEPFYDRSLGCLPRGSPEVNTSSMYKSNAELASHKALCKTELKHTPTWDARPASFYASIARQSSRGGGNTEVRHRRSKSADSVASRGSKSSRQPGQTEVRTPRPETSKMSSGRHGGQTSARRRASTTDAARR